MALPIGVKKTLEIVFQGFLFIKFLLVFYK